MTQHDPRAAAWGDGKEAGTNVFPRPRQAVLTTKVQQTIGARCFCGEAAAHRQRGLASVLGEHGYQPLCEVHGTLMDNKLAALIAQHQEEHPHVQPQSGSGRPRRP